MNEEQMASWRRIEAAPIISREGDEPFLRKLMIQNGWSREFAERCVTEYRKFVFLAIAAGHSVSPSDSVDQVWHLHLTYTEAYWKVFCAEVLCRPLHHTPSKGGATEVQKFQNWYERTLGSYRSMFGTEPSDIWPDVSKKAAEDWRVYRRVDTGRHWIVPKPVWLSTWGRAFAGALMILCAFGCSTLDSQQVGWIVDGPSFLLIYLILIGGAVFLSASVRRALTKGTPQIIEPARELTLYEIAFLAGGARRVLQAILVRLHGAGTVALYDKGKVVGTGELQQTLDPMEAEVRRVTEGVEKNWDELRDALEINLRAIKERLEKFGYLVQPANVWKIRAASGPAMGIVLVIGLLRLWHAFLWERHFVILLVLLIAGFGVMLWLLRRPFRTEMGDSVLEKLKHAHAEILQKNFSGFGAVAGAQLALSVGLLGISALKGTALEKMEPKLGPESGGGCGGGCGNGCGGAGCGGGCGGCGGCG